MTTGILYIALAGITIFVIINTITITISQKLVHLLYVGGLLLNVKGNIKQVTKYKFEKTDIFVLWAWQWFVYVHLQN